MGRVLDPLGPETRRINRIAGEQGAARAEITRKHERPPDRIRVRVGHEVHLRIARS
jgi:hypothetical protein